MCRQRVGKWCDGLLAGADKPASFTVYQNYWDWESGSAQGGLVSANSGANGLELLLLKTWTLVMHLPFAFARPAL
jgi:hypothetical protein